MSWSLFLLLHAGAFGLAAVLARLLLAYRRSGVLPLSLGRTASARGLVAHGFYLWLPLADLLFLLCYALGGDAVAPLWHGGWPPALRWIGAALLLAALVQVVSAQAAMGRDWRMGVDEAAGAGLRTGGPFARSRHPVYLGIRATLLAQLLVTGSWPMLVLWLLSELLVQLQARFEEEAMEARFGQAYRDYCRAVRRWL